MLLVWSDDVVVGIDCDDKPCYVGIVIMQLCYPIDVIVTLNRRCRTLFTIVVDCYGDDGACCCCVLIVMIGICW